MYYNMTYSATLDMVLKTIAQSFLKAVLYIVPLRKSCIINFLIFLGKAKKLYSNPILFVLKILLLFREHLTKNR